MSDADTGVMPENRDGCNSVPHGPLVDGMTLVQWSNRLYGFGQYMHPEERERFRDALGIFQDRLVRVLDRPG